MPLECQLSIRLLDIFIVCTLLYTQYLVVVLLRGLLCFDLGMSDFVFNIELFGFDLVRRLVVYECVLVISEFGIHITSLHKSFGILGVKLNGFV